MDRRERIDNQVTAFQAALQGWTAGLWVALPGILQSFNGTKRTATVQPSIQAQIRDTKGTWQNHTLPLLLDCPVVFPGGGGYGWTFPLAKGDEGLVIFASRCIDAWWQSGGVQPQAELRSFDLSDGIFFPGLFSQPRLPAVPVSMTSAQIRSDDGSTLIDLSSGKVAITANEIDLTARNKLSLSGGGVGVVYTAGNVDDYTEGTVVTPHVPPVP